MIIQLVLCLCLGVFSIIWQKKQGKFFPWLNKIDTKSSSFCLVYLSHVATFLIAYSQLIPINMYFGMEFIKLLHVPLIKYDKNMFDLENNRPTVSRTSELIEELGQVKMIFSDKTGTLTKNNMVLKKVCIKEEIFNLEDLVKNMLKKKSFIVSDLHDQNDKHDKEDNIKNIIDFFRVVNICNSAILDLSKQDINCYNLQVI